MHDILLPIVATSWTGESRLFYDLDAFSEFARANRGRIEEHFLNWMSRYDRLTGNYVRVARVADWIVRDDRGRFVDPARFQPTLDEHYAAMARRRRGDFVHRDGPVPGVRRGWKRPSQAARKRHGGRGVAARIAAFHVGDPMEEARGDD